MGLETSVIFNQLISREDIIDIIVSITILMVHAVGWLRYYATSWKVTGSIPDEVTEFFN
jgi:hypothetical protein